MIAGMAWYMWILLIWSGVWKAIALWKSARNKHTAWFIVMFIVNTIGILPIIYIAFFSKPKKKVAAAKPVAKKKAKKRKK